MSTKKHKARIRARMDRQLKKENDINKAAAASLAMSGYSNYLKILVFQRDVARIIGLVFFIGNIVLAILLWKAHA